MKMRLFPEHNCEDHDGAVTYTPFIGDNNEVGYRAVGPVKTTFIYLNPSNNAPGEDVPNVFVYIGEAADPSQDTPVHHYTLPEITGEMEL